MKFARITLAVYSLSFFIGSSLAQSEGVGVQAKAMGSSAASSAYSCDPNVCKLSKGCLCASKNPPNGLSPSDTPQFVTVTFDDSIQPQLYRTAKRMLNVTYDIYSLFE